MSDSLSGSVPIAILFALAEERAPFERRAALRSRRSVERFPECVLACSGMGIDKAAREAEALINSASPSLLIVCGFGGGLTPNLVPGDVFVAKSVKNLCGADPGFRSQSIVDPALTTRAGSVRLSGGRVVFGPLVTVDHVFTRRDEKQTLAATGAAAVDMESAGAIRSAEKCGVPWLSVRAITDGAADELPFDFNAMTGADGVVDRKRVAVAAVTHPWKIPALIRLGQRSGLAGRNLAEFLVAFLKHQP